MLNVPRVQRSPVRCKGQPLSVRRTQKAAGPGCASVALDSAVDTRDECARSVVPGLPSRWRNTITMFMIIAGVNIIIAHVIINMIATGKHSRCSPTHESKRQAHLADTSKIKHRLKKAIPGQHALSDGRLFTVRSVQGFIGCKVWVCCRQQRTSSS